MIPIKLNMRNFMSYRDTNGGIDFRPIHLGCLTGDNGHGKSALLDAMTWALWGKARAKRDDDLIMRGESEMEVCFEFGLGEDHYRVIRRRNNKGRGASELHFQVRHNGRFAPLNGGTLRETQQRIIELLRLDYDTFVNSAFLLQGRADEFTTKRPSERKQILADILGLSIYDTFAERAREKAREAERERDTLDRELEEIRREADKIPLYEQAVIDAEALAKQKDVALQQAEQVLRTLLNQKRELDLKAEQLTPLERRASDTERQIRDLHQRIADRTQKLRRYDDLLVRAQEIEAGYTALQAARQEVERWGEITRQLMELRGEQSEIQRAVDAARHALERELHAEEQRVADRQRRVAALPELRQQLTAMQADLKLLETQQQNLHTAQARLQAVRQESAGLDKENQHLREQMEVLRGRLSLLEANVGAACPVCRQELSSLHRDAVLDEMRAEGKGLGDRYRQNRTTLAELAREEGVLEQTIGDLEIKVRRLGAVQSRVGALTQTLEESQAAEQESVAAQAAAALLRQRLDQGAYALDQQERLTILKEMSTRLGYDRAAHEEARRQVQHYSPFESEHSDLKLAHEARDGEQAMLATLQQQLNTYTAQLHQIQTEIATLRQQLAGLTELLRRTSEQQQVVNEAQIEAQRAQRRLGGARQQLEFAEQQSQKIRGKLEALAFWTEERAIFGQLQFACGPRGLQAMLIEQAIPELEEAANDLLGRMTDGRMSIKIETQREGKTTDTPIETLDVFIADEHGERPYELFSGGEAFRANFALRIALSKLLARRAGARLQTLVIDEGFGTQDAQGRERLVEAITAIQDDFEKILVITHVDELKDAFPTRVDIVKGPNGSQVLFAESMALQPSP